MEIRLFNIPQRKHLNYRLSSTDKKENTRFLDSRSSGTRVKRLDYCRLVISKDIIRVTSRIIQLCKVQKEKKKISIYMRFASHQHGRNNATTRFCAPVLSCFFMRISIRFASTVNKESKIITWVVFKLMNKWNEA